MFWLYITLASPALSAFGNYLDKYLISGKGNESGVGSVVLFSCLFGILVLPISLLIGDRVFSLPFTHIVLLVFNGTLTVGALLLYLHAIDKADVISVVPVLQTVPVFGFAFGFLILNEVLGHAQILGSLVIVSAALLLSIEFNTNHRLRVNMRGLQLALLSSFLLALSGALFKFVALDYGYWATQFWEYVGSTFFGLLLFLAVPNYRFNFLHVIRERRLKTVGLNLTAEITMVGSDLVLNYATLLAPLALVYSVSSFQPVFLFVYCLIGIAYAPHIIRPFTVVSRDFLAKGILICVMIIGALIINLVPL